MSLLTTAGAVASQWRWAVAGLLVAAGLILGWSANGWRLKAAQAAEKAKAYANGKRGT